MMLYWLCGPLESFFQFLKISNTELKREMARISSYEQAEQMNEHRDELSNWISPRTSHPPGRLDFPLCGSTNNMHASICSNSQQTG